MHTQTQRFPYTALAALAIAATTLNAQAASQPLDLRGQGQGQGQDQDYYRLEDGRTLEISRQGRRLLLYVDGGAAEALAPLSPSRLRSGNGRLKLQFNSTPKGSVYTVRWSAEAADSARSTVSTRASTLPPAST